MRMPTTALSRHGLERRRNQLNEMQRFLTEQEQTFDKLRSEAQRFVDRYTETLGEHYLELDALESQLHSATHYLAEALRRNGVDVAAPPAPQATALPLLPQLPVGAPQPAEQPPAGLVELAPPSLRTLYRRAAMRLHPDFASDEAQRQQREQSMMQVNQAYAKEDRHCIAALLLAAGEDPIKVNGGGNADAIHAWLSRSERAVQGRLRVVQAHLSALLNHPTHKLCNAITQAEEIGLDPLGAMACRLRSQIQERRRELYIGQRLQAESTLAQAFLHRRIERMAAAQVSKTSNNSHPHSADQTAEY